MNKMRFLFLLTALGSSLATSFADNATAPTAAIAPKPLIDFSVAGAETKFIPTKEVTVAPSTSPAGVVVTVQPTTSKYPSVTLKPEGGVNWDLSPFGYIEAVITNLGDKPIRLAMRIDGASWQDNSAHITPIKPGETGTAKVWFGYNYGQKSTSLKTSSLSELLFVAPPPKDGGAQSFRIESIQASGTPADAPPIDKNIVRITPPNGVLIGAGAKPLDATKNLATKGGTTAELVNASGVQQLALTFPAGKAAATAGIKPEEGKWGLTDGIEIRAKVRNDGTAPIIPKLHVDSNGGPIEATASAPLAPGAEVELIADYRNPKIWQNPPAAANPTEDAAGGGDPSGKSTSAAVAAMPGTGNVFTSNQITDVVFMTDGSADTKLTVESLKADMPPISIPDWLGKKPPADGDWTMTLDEQFKGKSVDETRWNLRGANYYDQRSHWSKDEVTPNGDSGVTIRYEKKTGRQNGDPTGKETDYAAGYMDTYGKWTQRYGYFECRMKLPTAPGLWPAFWLMPDRGENAANRNTTKFGGMELDIVEHLTGWGPNRYNIANHWDGYAKEHKATGNDRNYVEPDKDGYITSGVLWTPGSAIYYCNGKELLRFVTDRVSNVQSFIIFSIPSGGWDNLPLDDTKLPSDWKIDYVRVWQRKDLATPEDGAHTPTKPIPDH